jgi:NAD(P)-dependent dehydrogenase (short-subunit alcohol dehydrogenase family)
MSVVTYTGKRVVVTGAASGIGAALVDVLRDADAAHVTSIDLKPVESVDRAIVADLSTAAGVDGALRQLDGAVDVLFANAGVAASLPLAAVMGVNVLAPKRLISRLLPAMPPGSAVVTTASVAGFNYAAHQTHILELLAIDDWDDALAWLDAHPDLCADPYGFSKECLQVLTLKLAGELRRHGVRINSVCPGIVDTPLIPDFEATMGDATLGWMVGESGGRRATPQEIANVLAFLGSDAAGYVNGANVIADGGFTAALNTGSLDFAALAPAGLGAGEA